MKKTIITWLLILTSLTTFAADKPISGLTIYNGAPGTNDLIPFVNRADVTQSTNGSTRSMTWSNVNWSLRTSYPAMTLTNIGSSGGYVNVTNIIGYNGSTFYGSGAVVDNWVFYGNNTFTGDTNRFASTVLLTNMNNTVSGNGAGLTNLGFAANNIGVRLLWSSPTNIYLSSLATNTSPTNAGNFSQITSVAQITVPALLGSNSALAYTYTNLRTNANAAAASLYWYAGSNTNFVGNGGGSAATIGLLSQTFSIVIQNASSYTNQIQGSGVSFPVIPNWTNFVDTSTSFTLYIGAATTTGSSHTNFQLIGFRLYEIYAP